MDATLISMIVRPQKTSHLCFEVSGIIEDLRAELGMPVKHLTFSKLYSEISAFPTVAGDPSRLLWDSKYLVAKTDPLTLATLRAESNKAALDQEINARQNAYFSKYANTADVILTMENMYSPISSDSKAARLKKLSAWAQAQADVLQAAYESEGRTDVVKSTKSHVESTSTGQSHGTEHDTDKAVQLDTYLDASVTTVPDPEALLPMNDQLIKLEHIQSEADTKTSDTNQSGRQSQDAENTDYYYRTPFHESQMQNERAQISLIDERFAHYMFGQNLLNLKTVSANELNSIDNRVYQSQINVLKSILMSPLPGMVTGIYKHSGELAKAGEPIIRIDDDEYVLLWPNLPVQEWYRYNQAFPFRRICLIPGGVLTQHTRHSNQRTRQEG